MGDIFDDINLMACLLEHIKGRRPNVDDERFQLICDERLAKVLIGYLVADDRKVSDDWCNINPVWNAVNVTQLLRLKLVPLDEEEVSGQKDD